MEVNYEERGYDMEKKLEKKKYLAKWMDYMLMGKNKEIRWQGLKKGRKWGTRRYGWATRRISFIKHDSWLWNWLKHYQIITSIFNEIKDTNLAGMLNIKRSDGTAVMTVEPKMEQFQNWKNYTESQIQQ